ncbi:MAG: RNA-binding protein [Phenylobacterium sp.]|uniref:RNA-binding protein n=1 Tax=Phenylobacterium sp. TaxID=1871053 RepID=UPI0025DA9C72|nr:RNA-binding protein [Phenylobacterium sp.]MCA6227686.1 RNA-binding protein [Phenylobacterium sp.]MCA6231146.1 RNA-binding protein [Phenylobacterium sp.]MCA6233584.1 RNA-binding protein [Phenylobacterium sp.]MCA6248465.1 RNA-binding protein [Phenylobacterium sp.]MCA6266348.1 RNA-binding protein [Phenylobacterium sp.]
MTAAAPRTPRTHAEASRESRDLVSGEVRPRETMIRFVAGPDGWVTPDLAGRLPGRGLWVASDRSSVETAARRGLFSRAARATLRADPDLADQVERLLLRRLLDGLGLARRAGELVFGFEKVLAALSGGRAAWLIEALDGSADGRRKILGAARKASPTPGLAGLWTGEELSLALGGENVIHSAFLAGRGSDRWTWDVQRLSGFRPLVPDSWIEATPPT